MKATSPYKRGRHPNSRKNLRPFQPGPDPRRCYTGARSRRKRAELELKAVALALGAADDATREAILEKVVDAVIEGALDGNPHLVRRVWDFCMRENL